MTQREDTVCQKKVNKKDCNILFQQYFPKLSLLFGGLWTFNPSGKGGDSGALLAKKMHVENTNTHFPVWKAQKTQIPPKALEMITC